MTDPLPDLLPNHFDALSLQKEHRQNPLNLRSCRLVPTVVTAEIVDPPIERTAYICTAKRLLPDDARSAIVALVKNTVKEVVEKNQWPGAKL